MAGQRNSTRLVSLTKWGGRLGVAGTVLAEGFLVSQYMSGDLTERQFWHGQASLGGGLAGGFAGAWVGAKVGAATGAGIGAAVGSIIPGAGTAAGAAIGASAGGFIGAIARFVGNCLVQRNFRPNDAGCTGPDECVYEIHQWLWGQISSVTPVQKHERRGCIPMRLRWSWPILLPPNHRATAAGRACKTECTPVWQRGNLATDGRNAEVDPMRSGLASMVCAALSALI
jgi:hypothetical protein